MEFFVIVFLMKFKICFYIKFRILHINYTTFTYAFFTAPNEIIKLFIKNTDIDPNIPKIYNIINLCTCFQFKNYIVFKF